MRKFDQLYFVAIVPPEPLKGIIKQIKIDFSEKYQCKAALKSPPHITLHMPFRFPVKREAELVETLKHGLNVPHFPMHLNGFGSFPPRVIYIHIENSEPLNELYKKVQQYMKSLQVFNADYKGFGFSPHLTIAFRDLKKSLFPAAWEEYQPLSFKESFSVESICLLKHNGKHWEEALQLPLL